MASSVQKQCSFKILYLKKIYKENGFKLYYTVIFLELEKAVKCILL